MKTILSTILLVSIVFSASFPGFAQRGRFAREYRVIPQPRQVPQTEFGNIEAVTDGVGVLIRWDMAREVGNLGFQVVRTDLGNKPVGNRMIPGAAASARSETVSGESYQTFDPKGGLGATYAIESVDTYGNRLSSSPVSARFVENLGHEMGIESQALIEASSTENGTLTDTRPILSTKSYRRAMVQPEDDLAIHRQVVAQPGVKIGIKKEGFYKISWPQLAAAGFNVSGKANNWRLFREGIEQAMSIGSGDRCIEFYGKGMDTTESDTRFYYLIAGTTAGRRIGSRSLKSTGGQTVASSFPFSYEMKDRTFYVPKINNRAAENYWGRIVFSSPENIDFSVSGIDTSAASAKVTVKMQGFPNGGNPAFEHIVRVRINGNDIGNISGPGEVGYSGVFQVPVTNLVEGTNTLQLTSMNGPSDINLFDTITVEYARKYKADQNKLAFTTPGSQKVDLTGFTSANVRVFDMATDGQITLIPNLSVVSEGGAFTVRLPSGPAMIAAAVEDSAIMQPASISLNNPSTLSTTANGAQLVILSHSQADFMAAAETWANYRRGQGISVKVIDIADVFDEFSYGSYSSAAVNSFLKHAANNWQTRARYAMLIGDGTSDPRSYQGYASFNFIPTRMVNLIYGESGSDDALADFNNDGLADMAIGRIPMRTAAHVLTVFNKTVQFETAAQQSLNRGALFAFDIPSGWDFQHTSELLRDELPTSMPKQLVGRGLQAPANNPFSLDPNAQTTLINSINTGKFIVNYAGHGTSGKWFDDSFFGNPHAAQLTNQQTSIFTMLTCLNGYFLRPDNADSISDVLLKNVNGGAVATWASTADTTPDIQAVMGVRFYDQLAVGNIDTIGDLILDAKSAIPGGGDVRLSWSLLGDPMLRVGQ